MDDEDIKHAISLIKIGEKTEARKILEPYIMANPHNILAWFWEAETQDTIAGKIKILEKCLQHNPNEPRVKKALANLNTKIPVKLKSCPYCGKTIKEGDSICIYCGNDLIKTESGLPSNQKKIENNRLSIFLTNALGIAILLGIFFIGLWIIQNQGLLSSPRLDEPLSKTSPPSSIPTSLFPPINPPTQTVSMIPSFTSIPTNTPFIVYSQTPLPTATQQPSFTIFPPTLTQIFQPTITIQNTPIPIPTAVPKTPTPQKPKTTVTCGVSPSVVPYAHISIITFYVNFSPPEAGLGFSADIFNPTASGQKGCAASDGDGDGYASCQGQSGLLASGKTIKVTLNTSIGICYAIYKSQ